jgi:hypothetical protein
MSVQTRQRNLIEINNSQIVFHTTPGKHNGGMASNTTDTHNANIRFSYSFHALLAKIECVARQLLFS